MISATTPRTLLMLDYDGTLTPIVPNYELAQIAPSHVEVLKQLTRQPDIQLAIVSGRSIEQLMVFLKDLEGLPVYLVGLHGGQIYDMQADTFLLAPDPQYLQAIETLAHSVGQDPIFTHPGIQIENKAFSLGVHFRQARPTEGQAAIAALKYLYETLGLAEDFTLKPGKQLVEVVPKAFNKGTGVEHLIQLFSPPSPGGRGPGGGGTPRDSQLPLSRIRKAPDVANGSDLSLKGRGEITPSGEAPLKLIFMGDDVTDFDAFRVVNAHGGETYYVGPTLPENVPPVTRQLLSVSGVYQLLETRFLSGNSEN